MSVRETTVLFALSLVLTIFASVTSAFALAPEPSTRFTATQGVVGQITDLLMLVDNDSAGAPVRYEIKFTLENDSLRGGSRIEIDFPIGYYLGTIDSISFADFNDSLTDFTIRDFTIEERHLSISLDSLEILPPPGTRSVITLFSINNPQVADDYQILLTLLTDDSQLLALPELSEPLSIRPGPLSSFKLSPKGIQQVRAGTTFQFSIETKDAFGNLLSIPGSSISWGVIGAPASTGVVENGSFQAQHTGASRVFASYQTFADTSGLVYVLPGAFAYFRLGGGADTTIAGSAWLNGADDVVITAYDLFGNVNYEFTGQVYFAASDPLAQLPYTQSSPLTFGTSDLGIKTITGSSFKFFTAGRHSLTLMMNGQPQRSVFPISVLPAQIDSYDLGLASAANAGEDLGISITNAMDAWDNAISGTASITLVGGGAAPSGALPSSPSFAVNNGSGTGTLRLVKAGNQSITITLGGKQTQRTISVSAAATYRFRFVLDAVQAVNRAFFGNAQLTALDPFDNIDLDFDASADTVRITSNGAGVVFNGVIGTRSAFADGVCDITDFSTGYNGDEPYVIFTARSKSGITGVSPTIGFSLLKISSGQLVQSTRYIGEQYTFKLSISNFGSQPANISAIRLYGNGTRLQPVQIAPGLSFSIPALSSQEFVLTGPVPSLPNQVLSIDGVFVGQISTGTVADSATALAQLTILPTDGISILATTLLPQQVSTERDYQFVVRVRNDSDDDLLLTTSSVLSIPFAAGSPLITVLASPLVVPGSGGEVLLPFEPVLIPAVASQTVENATIRLVGTLGTATFDQSFVAATAIKIETPPVVSYRVATLDPATVYRGADAVFSVGVRNTGTAVLEVDVAAAEFTIYAGERQLLTRLDSDHFQLANGDSVLTFKPVFVPVDFPLQNDSLSVTLRGTSNGHEEAFRFTIPGSAVAIPFGAATRMVSLTDNAPNMPYVNVGQVFKLHATVRNTGDEDLVAIKVQLSSTGSSTFTSQQTIDELGIGRDTTIDFNIEASFTPNASEVFTAQILQAQGKESELAALIQPPLINNTRAIVIQSPASLDLDARIWSPASAQDGVVGLGESFTLTSLVNNIAQSGTSGGEVTASILKGDFNLIGPAGQSFVVGTRNFWDITAPADEDTGLIVIGITTAPADVNTGLPARLQDRADTIQVISTVSQVGITVDFEAAPTQLLSAGGEYEIISLNFRIFNPAANPYMNFIKFELHDRADAAMPASSIIASARLRFNDQVTIDATADGNALRFDLGESRGIPTSGTITVTLVEQPAASDFVLYLDSLSFSASYETAVGARAVPIAASFAQRLVIEQMFTLVPSALTESFFSFPNPFSPLHEQATIVYNLSTAKSAKLKIYTLAGEEVITKDIPAPASITEPVQVLWDGRNGNGQIVLNGVYIAVLAVDGEAEIRTKIAVVK